MLQPNARSAEQAEQYRAAAQEIIRGIRLVSGLSATEGPAGWVAVECGDAGKARWLSEQIAQENVASYSEGTRFFVPVGHEFTLKGEIKSVITVVAKTTHYWIEHLPPSLKQLLHWEHRLQNVLLGLKSWFGKER